VGFRFAKLVEDGEDGGGISWPVRVVWVAGYADEAVFRQRAGRPGIASLVLEPAMCSLVMDVYRIG
jgi:hypothetical protein